jgi:predicted molibdopterin-dependent oxidoreductase YjgC
MFRFDDSGIPNSELTIRVDGEPIQARPGETIAAALYAAGIRSWRVSRHGDRRGLLCGMGTCCDCLLTVDGRTNVRACQELVAEGQVIQTERTRGTA